MLNAQCNMLNGGAWLLPFIIYQLALSIASAQTLESTESRFLNGLRERRLFELAESHCRLWFGDNSYPSTRKRAEVAIELSRTRLEWALYSRPPMREERFAAAFQALDERNFAPGAPWLTPFHVQRGVGELVWGELLREEAQTLNAPESALTPARDYLSKAVTTLRQARGDIDKQLQAASRVGAAAPKPDELSAAEWTALKRNVDYQLARAYRNQGETYPPRSADRTASLDQALETLALLARSETTDALTWQARLDEVVCRRLLGDLDGAERMLGLIDEQKPPPDVADRARAQRIRVRLDAALPDEAQKFVRETDAEPSELVDPDVRLAVLEWMLATARAAAKANNSAEIEKRQQLAGAMARLIADRHSAYWARRAESLMATAIAASPVGDVATLIKAAESLYQQGNADRAVELYDQAIAKADAAKQSDVAFNAAFTAAAIEQQRGRHAAAAGRYLQLAEAKRDHLRAAEAHLAGIFNTAQALAQAKDRNERDAGFARYDELLERHLAQWPQHSTTSQARLWLGRLRWTQNRFAAAVAAYAGVPPTDAQADEAVAQLAMMCALYFNHRPRDDDASNFAAAERAFVAFAPGLPESIAGGASPTARLAARQWASLQLQFADDRSQQAAALLAQLASIPDLPPEELLAVETLRVAADVKSGKIDEATLRIGKLTRVSPTEAAAVSWVLDRFAEKHPELQNKTAPIVLRVLELRRLHDRNLAPSAAEANALAAAGRIDEAKRMWEAHARRSPHDGDLQEEYARFLSSQADAGSLQAGIAKWREVEKMSAESSPRWYRARLGLAQAFLKNGDHARAAQILELTAALHPDLGGPELKAQFDQLIKLTKKP